MRYMIFGRKGFGLWVVVADMVECWDLSKLLRMISPKWKNWGINIISIKIGLVEKNGKMPLFPNATNISMTDTLKDGVKS